MRKLSFLIVPIAVAVGIGGLLRADDTQPPVASAIPSDAYNSDAYIWYVEHYAAVAKDSETAGVAAVLKAQDVLKGRDPQVAIDFYTKALYDAKSPTVQRAVRFQLFELYKAQGQNDKALDQLQQLIEAQ
jgi:hypothetical protein